MDNLFISMFKINQNFLKYQQKYQQYFLPLKTNKKT